MKKLINVFILIVLMFLLNGCAAMYVSVNNTHNIKPHVKKELIENEKRRRIKQRKLNKIHRERRFEIDKVQSQPGKNI